MTSPDDPEERIRQLEQSAAAYGARELGTDQPQYGEGVNPSSQLPPPAYGLPPPAYGSPPSYGQQPYGQPNYGQQPYGDPYQPPFGTHYTPIPKKAGVPVGVVIGLIALVFVILAGIGVVVSLMSSTIEESGVAGGGGSVDNPDNTRTFVPPTITFPSFPDITGLPSEDTEQTATADAPASVSGIDETKTVVCQNGDVNISGVNNTVTLTGNCGTVSVSGVENKITVDSANAISASGFDNEIVYLSGDPQINTTDSNKITRG